MSNHLLIKFDDNWADKMNIKGFWVCTRRRWDKFVKVLDQLSWPREVYWGTNEQNYYHSQREFMSRFRIIPVSRADAKALMRLLPSCKTGYDHFENILHMEEQLEDELTEAEYSDYGV